MAHSLLQDNALLQVHAMVACWQSMGQAGSDSINLPLLHGLEALAHRRLQQSNRFAYDVAGRGVGKVARYGASNSTNPGDKLISFALRWSENWRKETGAWRGGGGDGGQGRGGARQYCTYLDECEDATHPGKAQKQNNLAR